MDSTSMAASIPIVIASACSHDLLGGEPITPEKPYIKAVTLTHCAFCRLLTASVCHHPIPGLLESVDENTSRIPKLCDECYYFQDLCNHVTSNFLHWQEYFPLPEKPEPLTYEWIARRRKCVQARKTYLKSRVVYEEFVKRHSTTDDPALPIVNERGVSLIPTVIGKEDIQVIPRRGNATTKRIMFDETIEHPEDNNVDDSRSFQRSKKGYVPGKWAAPEGSEWLNTSTPKLYGLEELPPKAPGPAVPAVKGEPNTITERSWRDGAKGQTIRRNGSTRPIPKESGLLRQLLTRSAYQSSIQGIGCLLKDQGRSAFVPSAFISSTKVFHIEDEKADHFIPIASALDMTGGIAEEDDALSDDSSDDSDDEEEFHEASESLHTEMLQRRRGDDDDDWTLGDADTNNEPEADGENEVDADKETRDRIFSPAIVRQGSETSAATSSTDLEEQSWMMPASDK